MRCCGKGMASGYLERVEDCSCVDDYTASSSLPLLCSVLVLDLVLWRLDHGKLLVPPKGY